MYIPAKKTNSKNIDEIIQKYKEKQKEKKNDTIRNKTKINNS